MTPATYFNPAPRSLNLGKLRGLALKVTGITALAGVTAICPGTLPSQAAGFNDLSSWTNATPCSGSLVYNCVATDSPDYNYEIAGPEAAGVYTIESPVYSTSQSVYVSFQYGLGATTPSRVLAEYSVDGTNYNALAISPSASSPSILLAANQTFSFRLTNFEEQPILGVSNFNTAEVPAPLPILGVAAIHGSIRRRRAAIRLRKASAARAATKGR
jgi:hypothetical protein